MKSTPFILCDLCSPSVVEKCRLHPDAPKFPIGRIGIPVKLIAFETTVNVTVGLPVQRTSVDHGTAFDIAWTGVADHTNLQAAVAYARRMAPA